MSAVILRFITRLGFVMTFIGTISGMLAGVIGQALPYEGEILYFLRGNLNTSYTPYTLDVRRGLAFQWRAPISAINVQWSPDYRHIVVSSGTQVTSLVARRGGTLRRLSVGIVTPIWSPHNDLMVMESPTSGGTLLLMANGDGTGIEQLTPRDSAIYAQPAWSPDSTQIALVRNGNLYTMTLADRTLRPLLETPDELESQPVWSPKGEWLAYLVQTMNTELHLINTATSAQRQLTIDDPSSNDGIYGFAWAADGERLVFLRAGFEGIYIYIAELGSEAVHAFDVVYPFSGLVGMSWVNERVLRIHWMALNDESGFDFYEDDLDTTTGELLERREQETLLPTRSPDGSMTVRYLAGEGLCIEAEAARRCIRIDGGTPINMVWLP